MSEVIRGGAQAQTEATRQSGADTVPLTKAEFEFLNCLHRGASLPFADRPQDRVRQKVRKLGLAEYSGKPKRWQITDIGIASWAAALRKANGGV